MDDPCLPVRRWVSLLQSFQIKFLKDIVAPRTTSFQPDSQVCIMVGGKFIGYISWPSKDRIRKRWEDVGEDKPTLD
jgi:hypothetical protein